MLKGYVARFVAVGEAAVGHRVDLRKGAAVGFDERQRLGAAAAVDEQQVPAARQLRHVVPRGAHWPHVLRHAGKVRIQPQHTGDAALDLIFHDHIRGRHAPLGTGRRGVFHHDPDRFLRKASGVVAGLPRQGIRGLARGRQGGRFGRRSGLRRGLRLRFGGGGGFFRRVFLPAGGQQQGCGQRRDHGKCFELHGVSPLRSASRYTFVFRNYAGRRGVSYTGCAVSRQNLLPTGSASRSARRPSPPAGSASFRR